MTAGHAIALTVLAGLALQALLNRLTSPRLATLPRPAARPLVSVLIPARNEAERIEQCVRSWLDQDHRHFEVVVYDDQSADGTAALVATLAAGGRVRLRRGGPLPPGWRGKPHACHRLRADARGALLVFSDADVTARPAALDRIVAAFASLPIDALSLVPCHDSPRALIRALVAVQQWAALAFVPSWLPAARRRSTFAAMNGQCIAIRADVYDAVGGFAAVRRSLAEDVAFGRLLVARGYRVRLFDDPTTLRCTPYATLDGLWRAGVRNLCPVFFGSPVLLVAAAGVLIGLYVTPPALLAIGAARGARWTWLPLLEIALGLAPRVLADRRAGYPVWVTLLHPVAAAVTAAMAVAAAAGAWRRATVDWRGRRYPATDEVP